MSNPLEAFHENIPEIEEKLGYTFQNKDLLTLAFVHRSFVNEHRELVSQHNERLEFLGDSVLGLLIADFLYQAHPNTPEGELSHLRSRLVQASTCAAYLEKVGGGDYLFLGKGERMSGGRGRDTIHADLFEAIIGAIFLDGGIEAAKAFLFDNFRQEIDDCLANPERNWKAELQDYAQRKFQQTPYYEVTSETGPHHSKAFVIQVVINGQVCGTGKGASKKIAQQKAAQAALAHISHEMAD